jgi:anti-sigma factor RsiW
MMNINSDNYELWLLRYAEQELTDAERREVEQWLAVHPEAAEELALYGEAPRLEKDEGVKYAAVPLQRSAPLWPAVAQWAAAAAVVAALMVPAMRSALVPEAAPIQVAEAPITPSKPSLASPTSPTSPTSLTSQASFASQNRKTSPASLPASLPEAPLLAEETPILQDTLSEIPVEETPSVLYVDDLIVYEDEPAPANDYAVNDVTYVNDDSGINPVAHFLGIFFKITR